MALFKSKAEQKVRLLPEEALQVHADHIRAAAEALEALKPRIEAERMGSIEAAIKADDIVEDLFEYLHKDIPNVPDNYVWPAERK